MNDLVSDTLDTPIYLYVKRHNKTGLMYFGKTYREPESYKGSGKHWKRHITKHGNDVSTIWKELFFDKSSLIEFAEFFSEEFDIVKSKKWANLIPENGLDGNPLGLKRAPLTEEQKSRISNSLKGRKQTADEKLAHSLAIKGRKFSLEHKQNISKAKSGKPQSEKARIANILSHTGIKYKQPIVACPHCGRSGGKPNMTRYHFDNCINKIKE